MARKRKTASVPEPQPDAVDYARRVLCAIDERNVLQYRYAEILRLLDELDVLRVFREHTPQNQWWLVDRLESALRSVEAEEESYTDYEAEDIVREAEEREAERQKKAASAYVQ
jgi:hypothetical protein